MRTLMIFLLLLVKAGPFLLGTITRLEDDDGSCFRSIKKKKNQLRFHITEKPVMCEYIYKYLF